MIEAAAIQKLLRSPPTISRLRQLKLGDAPAVDQHVIGWLRQSAASARSLAAIVAQKILS